MSHRKKVTLHDLQSLIWLLNFACVVIVMGRAYVFTLIQKIIDLTERFQIICFSSVCILIAI